MSTNDLFENHCFITDTFIKVVERHAPLKEIRPKATFVNKKLIIEMRYNLEVDYEIIFVNFLPKKSEKSAKYNKKICVI